MRKRTIQLITQASLLVQTQILDLRDCLRHVLSSYSRALLGLQEMMLYNNAISQSRAHWQLIILDDINIGKMSSKWTLISVSRLSEFKVQKGAAVMETIVESCFAPSEQLDE